jgi:acetylornithine/N-succinyldiaminopimelate aminotransferase
MSSNRQLFLHHVAQTSPAPIGLEIVKAAGCSMWDKDGKEYLDLISGFSVMNIGHSHPVVIDAIKKQVDEYMHLMVYGELIETPQVAYAKKLTEHLPSHLDCVYFTNSGTEATEGAMKLAKRVTGRTQIVAFNKSYHGSTQGALSIMGDEYWRNAYRPLLPGIVHVDFNSAEAINAINDQTACVIMETVQAEAGVVAPDKDWIKAIRKKCDETGNLLVLDEIQTGFGRTGTLWAFEQFDIVPDILLLGKALGGGLPLGAFIASHAHMQTLTNNPVLGHISTFAGHPVSCAAGLAAFEVLLNEVCQPEPVEGRFDNGSITGRDFDKLSLTGIIEKAKRFNLLLVHPYIKAVRSFGLLMSVEFADADACLEICHYCIQNGVITDWFLFAPHCLRIAPPLVVSEEEVNRACKVILAACDNLA